MIHHYISEELAYALGWTLVHSLWQGLAIGLILFTSLHFTKQKAAVTRYWMSNMALLSLLASTVFTFQYFYSNNFHPIQEVSFQASAALHTIQFSLEESPVNLYSSMQHWLAFFDENIVFVSSCWFIGLLVFATRLLISFAQVRSLRNTAKSLSKTDLANKLNILASRLGLRQYIPLFESAHIRVPMTLGYLKPIVLLPIGTINQLTPEQVEAIIAHELAHIARHDYLFNSLQSLIEVVFFYHPVVWWMSANIRKERENCCDDLVIRLCNNSLIYAKALVRVQELQQAPLPRLALTLFGNKKQLLTRIQRILNHPQSKSSNMEKLAATGLLVVVFCFYSATNIWQADATESPIETETPLATVDTIPEMQGTSKIRIQKNGEDISVKVKDGVIQSLKIDGKAIPASEFEEHEAMVKEIIENVPSAPPVPPAPPVPDFPGVVSPKPPGSLVPPIVRDFPRGVPSAPPAPPAPPSVGDKNIRIEKRVEEDGSTYLHIKQEGSNDATVIRIEDDDDIHIKGSALFLDPEEEGEHEVIILKGGTLNLNGRILAEVEGFDFDFKEIGNSFQDFDFENFNGFNLEDLENFEFDFNFDSIPNIEKEQLEEIREEMELKREEMEVIREEMEIRRAEMHEIRERAREEAHESMEEARASMKEAHKEMLKAQKEQHEAMKHLHEEQREIHKQHQKIHEATKKNSDKLLATIKKNLLKDGLINNGKKYKFSLNSTELIVNGKTQSKAMFKKYKALVESLTDNKIDSGDEVKIKVNGSTTSTSVSFNDSETISIDTVG